jgi:hypothetical protein
MVVQMAGGMRFPDLGLELVWCGREGREGVKGKDRE